MDNHDASIDHGYIMPGPAAIVKAIANMAGATAITTPQSTVSKRTVVQQRKWKARSSHRNTSNRSPCMLYRRNRWSVPPPQSPTVPAPLP